MTEGHRARRGRMAIPQDLYEAAAVDGPAGIRRFIYVTFPLLANLYLISGSPWQTGGGLPWRRQLRCVTTMMRLGCGSVDQCCNAWNRLINQPWTIMSIELRQWAHWVIITDGWYTRICVKEPHGGMDTQ